MYLSLSLSLSEMVSRRGWGGKEEGGRCFVPQEALPPSSPIREGEEAERHWVVLVRGPGGTESGIGATQSGGDQGTLRGAAWWVKGTSQS